MERPRVSITMPAVSVKIVLAVHFVLTTWATLWPVLPASYVFSNYLMCVVGLWTIADTQRTDPAVVFLVGMLFTIISDIVAVSIYYNASLTTSGYSTYRFAVGMAILNIILKPLFCICIFLNFRNRGGEVDTRWAENPYVTIEGQNADTRAAAGQQS